MLIVDVLSESIIFEIFAEFVDFLDFQLIGCVGTSMGILNILKKEFVGVAGFVEGSDVGVEFEVV